MPEAALMQRPENTTPTPFAASPTPGTKRSAVEEEEGVPQGPDDGGQVIPDQIFLSKLPPNIEEKRLEKALKHVGKIERIHLARDESAEGRPCRGYGWVTFSTPEEAQAACDLSDLLECGGRMISICLSRPRKNRPRKKREVQIVIEP